MTRGLRFILVLFLFGLLILTRAFENELFYDPLIRFFKVDHSTELLPPFKSLKLVANTSMRFLLNTLISLAILWVIFRKREIIKVSALLYAVLFVALIIPFVLLINSSEAGAHMALFYVRRFLIQPVFILLLIPAFYFQKKV